MEIQVCHLPVFLRTMEVCKRTKRTFPSLILMRMLLCLRLVTLPTEPPSASFNTSRTLVKDTSKNFKIFIAGKRDFVFIESHQMNIVIKTCVGRPRITSLSQTIGQSLNTEPVFRMSFYVDDMPSFSHIFWDKY